MSFINDNPYVVYYAPSFDSIRRVYVKVSKLENGKLDWQSLFDKFMKNGIEGYFYFNILTLYWHESTALLAQRVRYEVKKWNKLHPEHYFELYSRKRGTEFRVFKRIRKEKEL